MRKVNSTTFRTFAAPTLAAMVSFVGLVAALVGDGWADAVSWVGLGIPVAMVIWAMIYRRA